MIFHGAPAALAQTAPAGSPSIPNDVTIKLAKDLANFQQAIQAASQKQTAAVPSEASKQVEVTSAQARVLDGASPSAPESFTAGKGQKLYVLDRANDYYAVASDHGATGWVTVGDVKPLFKMGTYTPWVYDDFKGMKVVSAQSGTGDTGAPSNSGFPEAPGGTADQGGLFVFLTQRAVEFRDEYKNNPYVQVSGFTVHVALIPSVDLSFSFK